MFIEFAELHCEKFENAHVFFGNLSILT